MRNSWFKVWLWFFICSLLGAICGNLAAHAQTYGQAQMGFENDGANPSVLAVFDGTKNVPIAAINIQTHTYTPPSGVCSNNISIGGTLSVSGATTLSGTASLLSTLGVTGATTLSNSLAVSGTSAFTGASTFSSTLNGNTLNTGSGTILTGVSAPLTQSAGTVSLPTPVLQTSTPTNPTATSSTTLTMAGLAQTFVPNRTGAMQFWITGIGKNSTAADGCGLQIRFGTGGTPTNGAPLTGTQIANTLSWTNATASDTRPFTLVGSVAGLTLGTTYWADLAQQTVTGGTCTLTNLTVMDAEQ